MLEKLKNEPLLVRGVIAAVLNVLVLAGVLDTGASEAVETAVLAVLNAVLLVTARSKVTPV